MRAFSAFAFSCCKLKQTLQSVCVCEGEKEREKERAWGPPQSAVTAACPLFFLPRRASVVLTALQDGVFSAVQFQRKAAKQSGTSLCQIRAADGQKRAGDALLYRRGICKRNRQQGQSS